MSIRPPKRPMMSREELTLIAEAQHGKIDQRRVVVIGDRGYYLDSMGRRGKNDFGMYDDALFILTPNAFVSFNANVDPVRVGWNREIGKPFAKLAPGRWRYQIGWHRRGKPGGHRACVQAGPVVVIRDDGQSDPWSESGWFGINIHRGGNSTTSSTGCQTIVPDQWDAFISLLESELRRNNQEQFEYLLLEEGART